MSLFNAESPGLPNDNDKVHAQMGGVGVSGADVGSDHRPRPGGRAANEAAGFRQQHSETGGAFHRASPQRVAAPVA